jgi:hypothetical protein
VSRPVSLPFGELTRPTLDEGHQQLAHIGTYALPARVDELAHIAGYALPVPHMRARRYGQGRGPDRS